MMEDFEISDLDIVSKMFLIWWNFISVLLSLLGNTFVLVASKHGRAIKLDRVSIVLLENLAFADIGTAMLVILAPLLWLCTLNPGSSFSAYSNSLFYKIIVVPSHICMAAGISLISFLNCFKLFALLFPLRARTWRYRDGYKIVAMVWIILTLTSSGNWIAGQLSSSFFFASSVAGTLLLLIVVLTSTFGLLFKVHKARGLAKQGVFSIILVSSVFFVCYTPLSISNLLDSINGIGTEQITLSKSITINIYIISCFSNPLIYYLTFHSFKKYTDIVFRKYFKYFRCNTSLRSN